MVKTERFVFRMDVNEKRMIGELSRWLRRNRSDAVREIIREAYERRTNDQKPSRPMAVAGNSDSVMG